MPVIIYIFSIFAFALGLAEFVPIGMTEVMAKSLNTSVDKIGFLVTAYALGATFSAPILTILTKQWSRKKVMLFTTVIFTIGSMVTALSDSLVLMIFSRFISGMGHGLFLAVASITAAKLAGPGKEGRAVAIVFGGFTIAMAIGVPLSTYLGSIISWKLAFGFIALFGAFGFLGLILGMKDPLCTNKSEKLNIKFEILSIFNKKLLSGAIVTIFAFSGAFVVYTYIASILVELTQVNVAEISFYTFLFGIFAAIGNVFGGKITDTIGINRANILIICGISLSSFSIWLFAESSILMLVSVSLLGFFSFSSVPALQSRIMKIAREIGSNAENIASGINIAAFNFAIALGSTLGAFTISHMSLGFTSIVGSLLPIIALMIVVSQFRKHSATL